MTDSDDKFAQETEVEFCVDCCKDGKFQPTQEKIKLTGKINTMFSQNMKHFFELSCELAPVIRNDSNGEKENKSDLEFEETFNSDKLFSFVRGTSQFTSMFERIHKGEFNDFTEIKEETELIEKGKNRGVFRDGFKNNWLGFNSFSRKNIVDQNEIKWSMCPSWVGLFQIRREESFENKEVVDILQLLNLPSNPITNKSLWEEAIDFCVDWVANISQIKDEDFVKQIDSSDLEEPAPLKPKEKEEPKRAARLFNIKEFLKSYGEFTGTKTEADEIVAKLKDESHFQSIVRPEINEYLQDEDVVGILTGYEAFSWVTVKKKRFENYPAEHQRYVLLQITKSTCEHEMPIPAKWFAEHKGFIANILEGTILKDGQTSALPQIPNEKELSARLVDLSTWDDEICFLGPERGICAYDPEKEVFERSRGSGAEAEKAERNETYWDCIRRGVEHSVTLRAILRILESNTTDESGTIPNLTAKIIDNTIDKSDERSLKKLSYDVANTFNLLPAVRDISIPISAYRSGHVVAKFEHLNNKCFHFPEILNQIQRNIDEATSYLQFFKSQQIQLKIDQENDQDLKHAQSTETTFGNLGIVIGVSAMGFVAPSFIKDTTDFLKELPCFVMPLCGNPLNSIFALLLYGSVFVIVLRVLLEIFKLNRESQNVSRLLYIYFRGITRIDSYKEFRKKINDLRDEKCASRAKNHLSGQ